MEQNGNILTPTLMAITAFPSHSPGLLNQGPGGLASLGHGPHSSIFFPTATVQSGASSAGCWFSLPHLFSNCLTSCLHLGYIIVRCPPSPLGASQIALNSTRPWSGLYPDIPQPDAPVIYTGAFPILTAWPGSMLQKFKIGKINQEIYTKKKEERIQSFFSALKTFSN